MAVREVETAHLDPLLMPLVQARDEAERNHRVEEIVTEYAAPIIKKVVGQRLHIRADNGSIVPHPDAEDVCGDVLYAVLERLNHLRDEPGGRVIHDFRGYVAGVAANVCAEFFRSHSPQRRSLKNKLRYLLRNPKFALWQDGEGNLLCGRMEWRGQAASPTAISSSLEIGEASNSERILSPAMLDDIFRQATRPLVFDDLVAVVADACGIKDQPPASYSDDADLAATLIEPTKNYLSALERQALGWNLQQVWREILQLPRRQRTALLLNLGDAQNRDVIHLLPETGTATKEEIAAALDIPIDRFAELWKELPLNDTRIAAQLNVTQRQVINLRKAARSRLKRRMNGGGTLF